MDSSPQEASPPLLRVRGLDVTFVSPDGARVHAVDQLDLDVRRAERFALVGESGCGKTTSILALMGLLPGSAEVRGRIELDGARVLYGDEAQQRKNRWRDVAMVFQGAMNSLNPMQAIDKQIAEPMIVHGVADRRAARRRAAELLEMVGIPARRAGAFPHELSGGMRQRTAIAMALACNPKLLIADEPTTALDPMVQAQIFEVLTRLVDELGIALILVTHDLPVVMHLCDRAAVMYAGRMVECAPVEQLYHEPAHPYTRLLIAASPDLRTRDAVNSIPGVPPRLDRPFGRCRFQDRCDRAFARCLEGDPPLAAVGPDQLAACWLHQDQS